MFVYQHYKSSVNISIIGFSPNLNVYFDKRMTCLVYPNSLSYRHNYSSLVVAVDKSILAVEDRRAGVSNDV